MAKTYTAIQTTTLSSATNQITFSSIPQTYTDLVFILRVARGDSASLQDITFRYNSSSVAEYGYAQLVNDSTGVSYYRNSAQGQGTLTYYGGINNVIGDSYHRLEVFSYANTSISKTALASAMLSNQSATFTSNSWLNTSAITSVTFAPAFGDAARTFAIGSTISLYGILRA